MGHDVFYDISCCSVQEEISCFSQCIFSQFLLPPANEVWAKVIFSEACVKNSVHRGWGLSQCMLGYHLPNQAPPLGPGTSRTRHPPTRHRLDQAPPLQRRLGDTVNERAICILLECNLVDLGFGLV